MDGEPGFHSRYLNQPHGLRGFIRPGGDLHYLREDEVLPDLDRAGHLLLGLLASLNQATPAAYQGSPHGIERIVEIRCRYRPPLSLTGEKGSQPDMGHTHWRLGRGRPVLPLLLTRPTDRRPVASPLGCSPFDQYRYPDPALGAWIDELHCLLGSAAEVERCRRAHLLPDENAGLQTDIAEAMEHGL